MGWVVVRPAKHWLRSLQNKVLQIGRCWQPLPAQQTGKPCHQHHEVLVPTAVREQWQTLPPAMQSLIIAKSSRRKARCSWRAEHSIPIAQGSVHITCAVQGSPSGTQNELPSTVRVHAATPPLQQGPCLATRSDTPQALQTCSSAGAATASVECSKGPHQ
jgi:hypothetical protein